MSSQEEVEVRDCEDEVEGRPDGPKRIKMRDLELVLKEEENRNCSLDPSTINKDKDLGRHKEEGHSEVTTATASGLSERLVSESTAYASVENVAACLTLAPAGTMDPLFSRNDILPIPAKEIAKETCLIETIKEGEQSSNNMVGLGVDLNSADTSSTAEHNPFYPFKKLGQIKSADTSECCSTTGPIEESEPLKMWKLMKQNGFLSSSHGGILMPKQRGRQPRKRKEDERKEQASRFTKISAPSGLLSGLNPGIINHVRNSKQVHSIIDAIVHSEKRDGLNQSRMNDQMGRIGKENSERRKEHIFTHDSATKQMNLPANAPCFPLKMEYPGDLNDIGMLRHNLRQGISSQLTPEYKDDGLTLKLSSDLTLAAENASSGTTDEFFANQGNINSLSIKAANVASQWLDLLQQDIKGRLAALKRSKKRVRNVIQTELSHLLSKEFPSNQENEPMFAQSFNAGSTKEASEMHVARWRSLFSQMDRELYEEGKQLENWLKQVQEMQLHCENGLRFVSSGGSSQLIAADDPSKSKKSEAVEREYAVRAAAASIYSTCNLIMATAANVQCF